METILFFLVIGAIQLAASALKNKKEKESKSPRPSNSSSPSRTPGSNLPRRTVAQPSQPIPDPVREIFQQFGMELPTPPTPTPPPPPVVPVAPVVQLAPTSPALEFKAASKTPKKPTLAKSVTQPRSDKFHSKKSSLKLAASEPNHGQDTFSEPLPPDTDASAIGDMGVDTTQSLSASVSRLASILATDKPENLRRGILWSIVLTPRSRNPWVGRGR